jgi:hypothetical protein
MALDWNTFSDSQWNTFTVAEWDTFIIDAVAASAILPNYYNVHIARMG